MVSSAFSLDSVADDGYSNKKKKASKRSLLNMPMHLSSKKNGYSAPENSKKQFSDSSKDRGSNPDLYESEYANVEETTSVAKIWQRRKFSSPIPDTVIGKGDEKGLLQKLAHSPLKISSLPFDTLDFGGILILITCFKFGSRVSLWLQTATSKYIPAARFGRTGMWRISRGQ